MKIIQIGASGHYAYAPEAAKKLRCEYVGIAMGDRSEKNTAMPSLAAYGFSPARFDTPEELFEKTDADVLVLNSYMGYNAKYACMALKRGISVFAEKPIATTTDDLKRVISAYRAANTAACLAGTGRERVCLCGMFGILDEPWFVCARELSTGGALGEIRLVHAQKSYRLGTREPFYSQRELYGGTIPWVSIHAIDWAWRFSGIRPVEVTARQSRVANGGNGSLESTACCLFTGENGAMISVSADYLRPSAAPTHDDDRIRLAGTEGILEVRDRRVFLLDGAGERELPLPGKTESIFERFLREIETGKPGTVSAMGSFYSTYLALCARQSADTGTTVKTDFDAFLRET